MLVPRLDGAWECSRAYVLGYRFKDDSGELWTRRFNAFKAGEKSALRGGLAAMNALLQTIAPPPGPIVVVGIPGSAETMLGDKKPVAWLAKLVAIRWKGTLDLKLIAKDPHEPIHSKYQTDERNAILDKANYRLAHNGSHATTYVIVDDFLTRGDTAQRIMTTIGTTVPEAKFWAVAMAKNEGLAYWRQQGTELTNNEATPYDKIWRAVGG